MSQQKPLSPRVKAYRDALRRERLAREEGANGRANSAAHDPFLDTKDGDLPVQLQGDVPALPKTPPSGNENDLWVDKNFQPANSEQANSLADFLDQATPDDLREAAEETLKNSWHESGPEMARRRKAAQQLVGEISDAEMTRIATEFIAQRPAYVADDESLNLIAMLTTLVEEHAPGAVRVDPDGDNINECIALLFSRGVWNVENLCACFDGLYEAGELPVVWEGERRISDAERRSGQVRAASGDLTGAILGLLQIALPSLGKATSQEEIYAAIADPQHRDVLLDIVISCWGATAQALAAGFQDTQATRAAIDAVLGTRPVTVDNVRAAFEQVKRSRRPASLEEQHATALARTPSVDELDDLSDDAVSDLLNSVVRDRARSQRRRLL